MASRQAPINSGFGHATTATEALAGRDLTGLNVIVTGGYSGLGLETVRVLAKAGAHVTVPARNLGKAEQAFKELPAVELAALNLTDPASVETFVESYLASERSLHILINGAGVAANPLERDARGYESQFSTNHLGHFQLTAGLWPALRRAEGARVVSVSSSGHRFAPVDFDDPNFERRPYDKWTTYAQSKTANALFAVGLDRRGEPYGVRAFSLHPGMILTDLVRHMSADDLRRVGATDEAGNVLPLEESGYKTVEQGAATQVWCATSPQLNGLGGVYCEDCDVAEAVSADSKRADGVRPWAIDPETAERLWTLSEHLVGKTFSGDT